MFIEKMFVKCMTVELVKITALLLPFPWKVYYFVQCSVPVLNFGYSLNPFPVLSDIYFLDYTFCSSNSPYICISGWLIFCNEPQWEFHYQEVHPISSPCYFFFFIFCKRLLSTKNNPDLPSREHSAKVRLFWNVSQRHLLCQNHGT